MYNMVLSTREMRTLQWRWYWPNAGCLLGGEHARTSGYPHNNRSIQVVGATLHTCANAPPQTLVGGIWGCQSRHPFGQGSGDRQQYGRWPKACNHVHLGSWLNNIVCWVVATLLRRSPPCPWARAKMVHIACVEIPLKYLFDVCILRTCGIILYWASHNHHCWTGAW